MSFDERRRVSMESKAKTLPIRSRPLFGTKLLLGLRGAGKKSTLLVPSMYVNIPFRSSGLSPFTSAHGYPHLLSHLAAMTFLHSNIQYIRLQSATVPNTMTILCLLLGPRYQSVGQTLSHHVLQQELDSRHRWHHCLCSFAAAFSGSWNRWRAD